MATKAMIKAAVDRIQDEYLDLLYRLVQSLKPFQNKVVDQKDREGVADVDAEWQSFVKATYGCFSHDLIQRGPQGTYERRAEIR